jgi:hypothetical protein
MLSRTREILDKVNKELAEKFNIRHTTLQTECDRCEQCSEGMVCQLSRLNGHGPEKHE